MQEIIHSSYWCCVFHITIEMGQLAAEAALRDAGIQYDHVQAVVASYCYGDPTCGEYNMCTMHT